MAILNWLTGADEVEEQRRLADESAREQFDPSVFQPAVEQARRQATEGIADEEVRQQVIDQIFGRGQMSQIANISGGNQARALAFADRMNQMKQESLAEAETQIQLKEAEAMQRGEQAFSEARSQQEQTIAQREATIAANKAKAEAEKERRKGALGSALGKVVGTVAGTALGGPAGAALGGALGGGLLGGGEGLASGATAGLSTAMQEQQQQRFTDMVGRFLESNARAANAPQEPEPELIPADIDLSNPSQTNQQPIQMNNQDNLDFMGRILRGQLGIF